MSKSFDLLIDGMIEALRTHVMPKSGDDFARGQLFSVIFALNGLKLAADWRVGPLQEAVQIQDTAFAAVRELAAKMQHPPIPATPRDGHSDPVRLEALRDAGDRQLGELLFWATGEAALAENRETAKEIERALRGFIRDQLRVEIGITAKSMLHQIATGEEQQRP